MFRKIFISDTSEINCDLCMLGFCYLQNLLSESVSIFGIFIYANFEKHIKIELLNWELMGYFEWMK